MSSTHLPRLTGEVRVGLEVRVRILAWVRMPPRGPSLRATRWKESLVMPGMP